MKTTLYLTLTLIAFVSFTFAPDSFADDASPEYVVRVIYFIPKDRDPDPNMDMQLDTLIKDAQKFYADQMEAHGFDRKTFRYEADENGNLKVHHINGKFNDEYYHNSSWIVWNEIEEQFDTSRNIYFLALDISNNYLDVKTTSDQQIIGRASGDSHSGKALIPASNFGAAIHELGHTFGLQHDSRVHAKRIYTKSTLRDWMTTSYCAAEWLSVSRYFNPTQEIINQEPNVEMLTPQLVSPPNKIRLSFEITDSDGLHQAQLFNPFGDIFNPLKDYPSIIGCKQLDGKKTNIEFVTIDLIDGNSVVLRVIDVNGNFTWHSFPINIAELLPQPEEILIPDPNLASAVREILDMSPDETITQRDMLRLKWFSVPEHQITDLTGLEHAIRLRVLILQRNQVVDIRPLSVITELLQLYIQENKISDIRPIAKLTQLTDLSITGNSIRDITPLASLTNLEYLDLTSLQISDIKPLSGLGNLENLWIRKTPIMDVTPLASLTQLKYLSLEENRINDARPIAELKNLQALALWLNQVSDLKPLTELTNLKSLDLRLNQIRDIKPLAELTNLRSLEVSKNQISDINPLTELTNLQSLGVAENRISDISALSELTNLHWLGLVENQIVDVTPLRGLNKVEMLALANNQISDVSPLTGLINLRFLSLANNPIKNRKPLYTLLRKNPHAKIYLTSNYNNPLPVTLSHFRAEHTHAGVLLKWTTESEIDNAGFYIYRSETKDGKFNVVNPSMIEGAGTTGERNEYTWTDTTAKPNTVYYYRIEDVSHAGVREQLATVRLRGLVSASGKLTTRWADLKANE